MTYGEEITRLCQLRDEMKKTPEGRRALNEVIRENPQLWHAYQWQCAKKRDAFFAEMDNMGIVDNGDGSYTVPFELKEDENDQ